MAKVNWDLHRKQFAQLRAEEGLTAREYAEHHGLNPNTARRELKKASDRVIRDQNTVIRDQNSDQNSDQKPSKRKSDHNSGDHEIKVRGRKLSHTKGLREVTDGKGRKNTPPSTPSNSSDVKNKNAKMITTGDDDDRPVHVTKPRGQGKRYQPGNEASIKTGQYAKPRQQDYIAADEMLEESIEVLATQALRESIAHMHLVQRSIDSAVEVLDEEIAAIQTPDPENEADPFGTHPTIKKAKLQMELSYLHIAHNAMLSGVITAANKLGLEDRKVALAEAKAANLDISANIVKQAIELRDAQDWSDIQTAEYIEMFGVKAPASLMARAAKAIANIQAEVDETGNVDDAALDAEARAYAESKIQAAQFVEQRRQEVAALTDRLGVGDYNEQGERKAGEIDDDYSDLDIDYDATSELYGDELPPPIIIEGEGE